MLTFPPDTTEALTSVKFKVNTFDSLTVSTKAVFPTYLRPSFSTLSINSTEFILEKFCLSSLPIMVNLRFVPPATVSVKVTRLLFLKSKVISSAPIETSLTPTSYVLIFKLVTTIRSKRSFIECSSFGLASISA